MKHLALAFSLLLGSFAAMPSAWAHEDEAPPKQLGEVAFANSCAPQAQESFERGVALLHSFGLPRARRRSAKRSTATRPAPSPTGALPPS